MENSKLLGEGDISKLLFKFSIPCVMGLLISALYNIVDQIFIGNSSLGYLGNAATGVSFPIICIANAFAWCVGDGAASYLSICAGRNDKDRAHKCVGTGITSSFIISIILTIICIVFAEPLMLLFGASDKTLALAVDYFVIVVSCFPFYLLLNVINSIIRADGSPSYAMIAMVTGAIINLILDPIFIFVLDLGIKGAAYATIIGQVLSFLVCIIYLRKPKSFILTLKSFYIDFQILKSLISLGGATFTTQIGIVVMTLLSNMALFHYGNLSKFGSDIAISVFSIQTKVYTIVVAIVTGIALGAQPILGFNYGAQKYDRVRATYKLVLKYSIIVGIIATLIFEFTPNLIINIFGSGNALYQEFALYTFRVYLSLCVITCLVKMTAVFFQSIGKSFQAILASVIRDIICIVIFTLSIAYLFERHEDGLGIYGVLIAAPLSDFVAGITIIVLTTKFFKHLDKLQAKEQSNIAKETPIIQESKEGFIITIAREHGSKGKEIGRHLANRLNIPFYYKEMTALAAKESGLAEEFVSKINENQNRIFHELYLSSEVIQQAVIAQEKIISKIAEKGSCVIVGRAADYVLRNNKSLKSIFLYAPNDYRIKNIMEMYGDTKEEALAHLIRSDEARSSYYENITGRKWRDSINYNLCVDTSIGVENTVNLIESYLNNFKK